DDVTVDMLLGIEPANRRGLCLVTSSVPIRRLLLSRYTEWCELLWRVEDGGAPAGMEDSVLCPPLTSIEPPAWWTPGEGQDPQACLPALEWQDVVRVSELPTYVAD